MRRALRILSIAILALVALGLLTLGLLATPPGRAMVAGMIERAASQNGLTVTIAGPTGWLPFSFGADSIVVADPDGPFAAVDGLDIGIDLGALLTGGIALNRARAARVAILRMPNLPPSEGGGGTPAFAAEEMAIDRLELGPELAGRPAVLTATGSVRLTAAGGIAAQISAERVDGRTGTLAAVVDRASEAAPLSANVEVREAADGILVGLMGRPAGPGYLLNARTGFDGETVRGDLALRSDGAARFDGTFAFADAGGGARRLVVDGSGDLGELVPPDYAALLSGAIEIGIDADWTEVADAALPRVAIRRGSVSTGALRATASGSFGTDAAASLTVSLDAANPDATPIVLPLGEEPLRLDSIALSGRITPSGGVQRLELTGRVAGLVTAGIRIPGTGLSLAVETEPGAAIAGNRLPFALRVEADAIETATGRIQATGGAPIVLTADGTYDLAARAAETDARLSIAGGSVDFEGRAGADAVTGRATADFADLRGLSPLVGRTIAGAIDATAEGTFTGPETRFTVEGSGVDLDPGEATAARLLAGVTGFAATVARAGDDWSISDARVDAIAFDASGSVALAGDDIDATVEAAIADLAALAEQSSGAATLTARITGARERPDVEATIAVPQGRLAGQAIDNAVVGFTGAPTDTGWQGMLTLSGGFAGGPLSGTAQVATDAEGGVTFPDIDLAVGDNRIAGSMVRTADGLFTGTLAVDAPRIDTLAALLAIDAAGSGRADVRLQPDNGRQSVSAAFAARDVAYGTTAVGSVEGSAAIADAFGTPLVTGNATARALAIGGLRLDTAEANATVDRGATRFTAAARGPDLDLSGAGSLSAAAGAQAVQIDTLTGTAFRFPVNLDQPVTIRLDGGQSDIAGATLALGGGTVRADGRIAPALDLTIVADNVAASVANAFAPDLGAEGTVSARATVTGDPAAPRIAWQATWSGLHVAATRNAGLPGLQLSARGEATTTATSLTADLTGAGLSLAISGQAPFAGAGLNLRAEGTAPLALLALEADRELRLAGTARVDLAITGSTAAPAINGTVTVVDGTFADAGSGFSVVGANGTNDFDGRRATIRSLTGRMGQGGEIAASGSIEVTEAGLPADVTIRVTNGRYSDGSTVNTTFSADLAVTGPLAGNGRISGRVDLGRTEIQLPERTGSATAIDVRHVNAPPGFVPPQPRLRPTGSRTATAQTGPGGLALDIALAGHSGVFVRGFGITAEMGGDLRIAGTTGDPQAVGGLTMQWGRIEVLGRRFDFTSGQITFSGSLMPFVDFQATTRSGDALVALSVVGPADDPQIRFSSSPEMPEEEILSQLLFQRGVGTLSPLQAAQLVDAVAQLTGAVGQGGILGRIRAATGLDDIDVRQTATGGTAVGIGRRINENIRLGVEAGTDAGSGRVVIDLDLTENIKAQAEAGQDGSGKIGLTYEREY